MCTCVSCMSAINLLYIYGQINEIIKTWQEKYQNTLVAGQIGQIGKLENWTIGQLDKVGSWFYELKQKEGNVVSIIQVELVGNNIIETRREWRNLAQTQWKKTNSLEKAVGNNAVDTNVDLLTCSNDFDIFECLKLLEGFQISRIRTSCLAI